MRENTDQKTPNTTTFYAVLSIIIMKYMTQVIVYIASTFDINTYAFIQLKMKGYLMEVQKLLHHLLFNHQ